MAKAAIKALLSPAPARKRRKTTITSSETTQELAAELNDLDRFNQIYYVAALMFCERGYHATSMSDIAEAVGITKAGVYHFIPGGKQDLLFGIMSYGMDTLDQCVIEPAKAIADAEERLRAIIKNHVRLITNGSNASGFNPVTIVVDEVAGLSPTQQRKIFQRKRKYLDLIRQTLEELKAEGKLKELELTVGAFSLLGMILWLARWYRSDGKLSADQISDEICRMAMGGILRKSCG